MVEEKVIKIIICDRCGKRFNFPADKKQYRIKLFGKTYDLCSDCQESLRDWLENPRYDELLEFLRGPYEHPRPIRLAEPEEAEEEEESEEEEAEEPSGPHNSFSKDLTNLTIFALAICNLILSIMNINTLPIAVSPIIILSLCLVIVLALSEWEVIRRWWRTGTR